MASTTAQYAGNAEFGEPADADASDDFIVRHPQYTASYNPNRGTPNWVGYDLDATHFGAEDRCDCFTMDPALPATFPQLTTADYTGAGAFHGYGIDRGHLARSFDRTTRQPRQRATPIYSTTSCRRPRTSTRARGRVSRTSSATERAQNKEVYIIAGVAGNKGTLKNEGKVVIPRPRGKWR